MLNEQKNSLLHLFFLSWLVIIISVAGCNTNSRSSIDPGQKAIKCAENWKGQGYDFDPNTMTCWQMFQKANAIRRAKYWKEKGYDLDPNDISREEMDGQVKHIDRAMYWKGHGYDFDPYAMTAKEMDTKVAELNLVKQWKERGYYYDTNSKTVFLTSQKKTKLSSLAKRGGVPLRVVASSYQVPTTSQNYSYNPHSKTTLAKHHAWMTTLQGFSQGLNDAYMIDQQMKSSDNNQKTVYSQPSSVGAINVNRYDPDSLANPYGAGSPYKADGLMNPYSQYGSPYSDRSWRNPYATDGPKLYDSDGNYRGKLSVNPYGPDSTSNPYGRYGSKYSPDSINNPYGAGNPYSSKPIYVVPSE